MRPALALFLLSACTDASRADGEACATPFDCRSGACLSRESGGAVCARRCGANADCASGDVCGRYDFRGRDDSGVPAGPVVGVLRACRAPLNPRCAVGCAPGDLCSSAGGVCVRPCASADDCGGRTCERDACGTGRCAAPCDHLDDCAPGSYCDLAVVDASGHGECAPRRLSDAGASNCAADP